MDAVSLKLARNYTNEKLNSLPSNAPTKTVSFDGGIYSVGNDVVNGQISDIVVKGLTATNLVKNGSFNNGVTNWTKNNSNFVANNGVAEFTATSKYGDVRGNNINLIIGNKYYVKTRLRLTTLTNTVTVGLSHINNQSFPAIKTLEQTTDWQSVSGIVTINSLRSTTNRFFIKDSRDSEFDTVYLDDVMVIDLTATFGAENEPTKEQCDQIFTNWFDGTKSTNSVRLRSVNSDETKESIAYVNLPPGEVLRSLLNGAKDEVNVTSGIKTQRVGNKTNVASGTVINYTDMATDGQFVAYFADGTSQTGVKGDTLTALATTLNYQLAQPIITKLPAQPPLQVYENGTVYVEPMGDSAESTLPTTELAIPTGTSNKFGVATHDYGGAAADWTLTNSESKCFLLAVSSAGDAANIIAPDAPGVMYAISNTSGQKVTVKISGGNGVDVNTGKKVLVIHDGTDYTALTAELSAEL